MSVFDDCKTISKLIQKRTTSSSLDIPLNLIPILQCLNADVSLRFFTSTSKGKNYLILLKDTDWLTDPVRNFLSENAFLICALVILYDDGNQLLSDLAQYLFDPVTCHKLDVVPTALYSDASEFIRSTHEEMYNKEALFTEMKKAVWSTLKEIMLFHTSYLEQVEVKTVKHVALHLSLQQQAWCLIASRLHNANEIIADIESFLQPRRKILYKTSPGAPIDFDTWRILSIQLPLDVEGASMVINDFKTAIYTPESRNISSVYGPKEIKHLKTHLNIPTFVIIRQMICLCLSNWPILWKLSRWPDHPEIIRRLLTYIQSTEGALEPKLSRAIFFRPILFA